MTYFKRKELFGSLRSLFGVMGITANALKVFREFEEAYGEDHRHYHTLAHIDACLGELFQVWRQAERADEIELAIWFHDLVHDTKRTDNEEVSAERAFHFCACHLDQHKATRVASLVRATRHQRGQTLSLDEALLVDVDLSILGQKPYIFDRYEKQVRKEYGWASDLAFRDGRLAVLRNFLERPSIYNTGHFRKKYEEQARKNLAHSIEKLRSS